MGINENSNREHQRKKKWVFEVWFIVFWRILYPLKYWLNCLHISRDKSNRIAKVLPLWVWKRCSMVDNFASSYSIYPPQYCAKFCWHVYETVCILQINSFCFLWFMHSTSNVRYDWTMYMYRMTCNEWHQIAKIWKLWAFLTRQWHLHIP
jgi:hypothetical protein